MKRFLLCLSFCFFVVFCFGSPIDQVKARQIAEEFYANKSLQNNRIRNFSQKLDFNLEYVCYDSSSASSLTRSQSSANENALYYVFNVSDEKGFVIVPGDDKINRIIGYSLTGNFSHTEMPEHLRVWMESYKESIQEIVADENEEFNLSVTNSLPITRGLQNSISPLLVDISWNQTDPFNKSCPQIEGQKKRAIAGCVPAAVGQVMRYYKWPKRGKGTKNYTTAKNKLKIEEDFNVDYNWENILPAYNDKFTETEADAVGKLIYHLGVAFEIDYDEKVSNVKPSRVTSALTKHFSYNRGLRLLSREHYLLDNWLKIIKRELNSKRPVLYAGQANFAGHMFVCDGYDKDDLFHLNWGWGGINDGYFDLNILGAKMGRRRASFSENHSIFVGVCPEGADTAKDAFFFLQADTISVKSHNSRRKGDSFALVVGNLKNRTGFAYKDEFAVVLEGQGVKKLLLRKNGKGTVRTIDANNTLSSLEIVSQLPSGLANGEYRMYPVFKQTSTSEWDRIAIIPDSKKVFEIAVSVMDDEFSFSIPEQSLQIEIDGKLTTKNGVLYQNKTDALFSFAIKNRGAARFNSKVFFVLKPKAGGEEIVLDSMTLYLDPGKRQEVEQTIRKAMPKVGIYRFALKYQALDPKEPNLLSYAEGNVVVYDRNGPTILLESLQCNKKILKGSNLKLRLNLQYCGMNDYSGYVMLGVYGLGEKNISFRKDQRVKIEKNSSKTIEFEIEHHLLNENKTYRIKGFYSLNNKAEPISGNGFPCELEVLPAKLLIKDKGDLSAQTLELTESSSIEVSLKNREGDFNDNLYLDFEPCDSLKSLGQNRVTLTAPLKLSQGEVGTAIFNLAQMLKKFKDGDYVAQLRYRVKKEQASMRKSVRGFEDVFIGNPIKLKVEQKVETDTIKTNIFSLELDKNFGLIMNQDTKMLELTLPINSQFVDVYDLLGRKIFSNSVQRKTYVSCNMNEALPGVYVVIVKGNFKPIAQKFLVK